MDGHAFVSTMIRGRHGQERRRISFCIAPISDSGNPSVTAIQLRSTPATQIILSTSPPRPRVSYDATYRGRLTLTRWSLLYANSWPHPTKMSWLANHTCTRVTAPVLKQMSVPLPTNLSARKKTYTFESRTNDKRSQPPPALMLKRLSFPSSRKPNLPAGRESRMLGFTTNLSARKRTYMLESRSRASDKSPQPPPALMLEQLSFPSSRKPSLPAGRESRMLEFRTRNKSLLLPLAMKTSPSNWKSRERLSWRSSRDSFGTSQAG
ncbi:hypothetical protein DHEL01_v212919 [Diaporthe helianthi]|uniref:Uncharacterized protein n=1 Tax=Diaporthe helianthi TaxID=158607 RepID=A0A2P5HEM8_DIAHE|nr:hypothetical protein DHEL01_v212919 [Diaporthe helianthi]